MIDGIGALQPHRAARARPQEGGVQRHARVLQFLDTGLDAGAEAQVELDVRRGGGRVGVPKAPGLEQAGGDRALLQQQVLQAGP